MDVGSDFLHAFACFVTFFFIFGITVPTELRNTYSFIESYILKVNKKDPLPEEYQLIMKQSNVYREVNHSETIENSDSEENLEGIKDVVSIEETDMNLSMDEIENTSISDIDVSLLNKIVLSDLKNPEDDLVIDTSLI